MPEVLTRVDEGDSSERRDKRWIRRTARALSYLSVGIACYWSDFYSLWPSWSPNWKLYLMFAAIGLLSSTQGFLSGWVKGYEFGKGR